MRTGAALTSRETLAWLAGLLEGEGSFLAGTAARRSPAIELEMADEQIVRRAARLLGVRVTSRIRANRPNSAQSFRFRVSGPRAAHLMWVLRPYLGRRRQRQIADAVTGLTFRRAAYHPRGMGPFVFESPVRLSTPRQHGRYTARLRRAA